MSRIQKLSIANLRKSDYRFAIPRSYQRGYRWRADNEVSKLLNDIKESNSEYSLQPLILCKNDGSNELYDVVDGQQRLTTILLILDDTKQFENFSHDEIDNIYIKNAKDQIEHFKTSLSDEEKTAFMNKVNEAFFISYIVEGDEDEVRKIFTRVNEGKIPLSSAELLKAWFFTLLPYKEIRDKWNEMEKLLEDDYFFYFINPEPESPRYYATRMDYLAELVEIIISGNKKDRKAVEHNWDKDKNYVFFSLSENHEARDVFEKLYSLFTTLKSCYEDIDTYNRIGFLINRKNRADQYDILTSLDNRDLNFEIKSIVGDPKDFNKLNYYDNHDKIENILLLFNLTFYKDKNSRFNFVTYQEIKRISRWTLDHIHAKNEKLLDEEQLRRLESQIDNNLLLEVKKKYPPNDYQFEYQNLLYDLRDHAQVFDKKTGDFVASDATIEKWIHGIGNLVLLEHSQNSSFSNSSVKEKLSKLKCSDERRKLFAGTLFAYNLAKRELWLKKENDEYLDEIKNRINTFLEEPIVKSKNVINCNFIFSSDETKDYGKTIDESFFKNNEPVSLIDILSRCEIVIPDFQREYAQGRCDKHSGFVRKMFLNDIFGFLKDETKEKMELDFIYGRINDRNEFFPYDGQQRLTTLFLIYAELCRENEEYAELLSQKFRYADRPEAEAYCKSCLKNIENPTDSTNASVKGMQEMRKAIKAKIKKEPLSEKEIKKLDSIVFYIPSDISLSTDIYWKMNSRGKRLTPLERFKSSWFGKDEEEQAKNIDKIAVKFFDANREKYEESFMSIISIMFNSFALIENHKEDKINFYNPELVPSSAYVAFKPLQNGVYAESLKTLLCAMADKDFDLIKFQDNFTADCPTYSIKRLNNEYQKGQQEKSLFFYLLTAGNLKEKSLLFSYLLTAGEGLSGKDKIKDWMRFCANIIWNASDMKSALRLIFELRTKAGNILSYLASVECEKSRSMDQYVEEIMKAHAIKNNEVKKKDIEIAESAAFADGRIDFLFYNTAGEEDWKNFIKKRDNFCRWFDDDKDKGVRDNYREAIVTAYIKLSPWDWDELYFDTSREHWKNKIFGGIHDKIYKAGYFKIVDGLLSATDLCSINLTEGESQRSNIIRKSLVDNPWFVKWMMNNHPTFNIVWNWHLHNATPIFTNKNRGQKIYIYWDVGGWEYKDVAGTQNKQITEFFKIMNGIVQLDGEYFRVIDDKGNEIADFENINFDENHLIVWGYYNDFCYVKFTYKKEKVLYLTTPGIIVTEEEYNKNKIYDILSSEKLYETRCIYQKQQDNWFAGNLSDKEKLKQILDGIVEGN